LSRLSQHIGQATQQVVVRKRLRPCSPWCPTSRMFQALGWLNAFALIAIDNGSIPAIFSRLRAVGRCNSSFVVTSGQGDGFVENEPKIWVVASTDARGHRVTAPHIHDRELPRIGIVV
jgi:hypothetical protein